MSNCEVTLLPSGASLVWALNFRLVFFVAVQRSLAWLSLFLALVFGVGAAAPALDFPLQLVPGCNELIYVMFLFSSPIVSTVGDQVDTPGVSQRYQAFVPSFALVGLVCGSFSKRFSYDLGLNLYRHIKYYYLK